MIIKSLLDTDFYKFLMMQAVFHQYRDMDVIYQFKCRNNVNLIPLIPAITTEICRIPSLKITPYELAFLRSTLVFKEDFLTYLET